jgi:hypothetical protein
MEKYAWVLKSFVKDFTKFDAVDGADGEVKFETLVKLVNDELAIDLHDNDVEDDYDWYYVDQEIAYMAGLAHRDDDDNEVDAVPEMKGILGGDEITLGEAVNALKQARTDDADHPDHVESARGLSLKDVAEMLEDSDEDRQYKWDIMIDQDGRVGRKTLDEVIARYKAGDFTVDETDLEMAIALKLDGGKLFKELAKAGSGEDTSPNFIEWEDLNAVVGDDN